MSNDLIKKLPPEKTVQVPEAQLQTLLDQNEEMKKDLATWRSAGVKLVTLFGVFDPETGRMKPEYVKSEKKPEPENPMPAILKSATSIMGLAAKTNLPGSMGRKAEDQLIEKFSFFSELVPLIEKYGNNQ